MKISAFERPPSRLVSGFDLSPILWKPNLKNFNQIKILGSLQDKYEVSQ